MKLATRKNGTRDGQLLVVNRSLTQAVPVPDIAPTLQAALDDWSVKAPKLAQVYRDLNANDLPDAQPFIAAECLSPLPRAYQWADGSAYVNHVELVRKARGAEMPASFWEEPLLYQGGSDDFLAPHDPIDCGSDDWGIDFEAEIAVITDDVPMGQTTARAGDHIKLMMLVNDVSLRNLIPAELGKGFGFYQSKPATAFSPVAVTPDELGEDWHDWRLHRPVRSTLNGQLFGYPNAGVDMVFNFAQLIAHAARTRRLRAGTIIGSGTVSNKAAPGQGTSIGEGGVGYSCIAERRTVETLSSGQPETPFMTYHDHIHIDVLDDQQASIFGAIDQVVLPAGQDVKTRTSEG